MKSKALSLGIPSLINVIKILKFWGVKFAKLNTGSFAASADAPIQLPIVSSISSLLIDYAGSNLALFSNLNPAISGIFKSSVITPILSSTSILWEVAFTAEILNKLLAELLIL
jgi:hypothetical protein